MQSYAKRVLVVYRKINELVVPPVRIELTAPPLPRVCSTPELRRHGGWRKMPSGAGLGKGDLGGILEVISGGWRRAVGSEMAISSP